MSDIPDNLTRDDLVKILLRDRFVKAELTSRVAGLVRENLELTAIIQELQGDLGEARQAIQTNGEVPVEVSS
jgi:hypothetical protein